MSRRKQPSSGDTLEGVEQRFESWRKSRKGRAPIPEELWRAAAELSSAYTVGKISKALRLDYSALKKHVLSAGCSDELQRQGPACGGFVEIDWSARAANGECVVELEDPGAKLKVLLRGNSNFDVAGLARMFWRKGR